MIEKRNIKSKALRLLWTDNDDSRIATTWRVKVRHIMSVLHSAREPKALDIPGLAFHRLKGDRRDSYAVSIEGPHRITFRWDTTTQSPLAIDIEDYHGK